MQVDEIRKRRTQYALGRDLPVSNEDVDALVRDCVRLSPTAFNYQGTRALILFGQQSDALWDITAEALREVVPRRTSRTPSSGSRALPQARAPSCSSKTSRS